MRISNPRQGVLRQGTPVLQSFAIVAPYEPVLLEHQKHECSHKHLGGCEAPGFVAYHDWANGFLCIAHTRKTDERISQD
jgi:hypothetical protein